jgi:hypothetical protein
MNQNSIEIIGETLSEEELRAAAGGGSDRPQPKTEAATYHDGVCSVDRTGNDAPILD